MENFWDMLHNWARIARIRLWKYRKKRMAKKARRARRKVIMQKPLLPKEQSVDKTSQQTPLSTSEITAMLEKVAQRFEDDHEAEPLQLPVEEKPKPKPKIKPMVFDDPNEVMGKSNIIYYEDPEVARKTPTRSIELKQVELPVDEDVNPDDVEDNFEPQKGLTEEDKRELMEPEGVIPDPDFDKSLTYEDMNNLVDVLNSDNPDEQKSIRAASTIHYKLANTVILDFLVNKVSNEDKVNQLLQECLDANGNPLPKRRKASKIKSFDINKYA